MKKQYLSVITAAMAFLMLPGCERMKEEQFPAVVLKETQVLVQSDLDVVPELFLKTVESTSGYRCGFRNPVLVRTDDQICAVSMDSIESETAEVQKTYTEKMDDPESLTTDLKLEEDGQYLVELVVADESGYASVLEIVVLKDSTPPTVEGNDPMTVNFDDLSGDMFLQGLTAFDNMFGDLTEQIVWEQVKGAGENLIQVMSVTDPAGNRLEFERETKVIFEEEICLPEITQTSDEEPISPNILAPEGFQQEMARAVLPLVNQARQEAGAEALSWASDLEDAAMVRAAEIAEKYAHERPDGSYADALVSLHGENIARGYQSANSVFKGWMASTEGHREQILKDSHTETGMACYCDGKTWFWVQLFR